jgi:hypothetical protein
MGKQDGNPPRSDACFPGGSSPKGERHQGSRRIHPASLWPCSDVYSLRIGPILASGFGFSSAAVVVLAVSLYAVRAADLAFNAGLFPQVTQSPRALRTVLSGSWATWPVVPPLTRFSPAGHVGANTSALVSGRLRVGVALVTLPVLVLDLRPLLPEL